MPPISDKNTLVRFADPLPAAVDVVVIGAGVAGTATAYFLAQRGQKVLLCEKGRVAGEQSSRNWGWIRQQARDHAELPIMIEANRIWRGLAAETGEADLTFTQGGCLYLATTQAEMAGYEGWLARARDYQLDTKLLSPADLRALYPGLPGTYTGGMYTASDGRGEPFAAIPALARAAQRLGVAVIEDCAVRTLDVTGGRVSGVVTEKGRVSCNAVVLAAGAWTTHFASNVGVDVPQLAVRCTVARTEAAPMLFANQPDVPNIRDVGFCLRRRADGGYTLATGTHADHYLSAKSFRYATKFIKAMSASWRDIRLHIGAPKGYPGAWGMPTRWSGDEISPFEKTRVLNPEPTAAEVRRLEDRMAKRYPVLAGVKLAEAWAGMIDVTPDVVPTLGEDPMLPGMFICTGLSGHGFGIGPAIGRVMADMVIGRDPGHDVTRFRAERFRDGSPILPGPYL